MSVEPVPGRRSAVKACPHPSAVYLTTIAGVGYLLILLCVWGVFATTSGLPWETYFTVTSESSPGWRGFFYEHDPMRIHNATFFHAAYMLGEAIGMRGSFVPYQIVYAVLWWARSFLAFLLIRRLLPNSAVLPFIIGALTLIHASDLLVNWIGQLHSFGFSVWLLFAAYMLVLALQQTTATWTAIYASLACVFVHMCLWTQEGPLFIVLAAPVVFGFLVHPRRPTKHCVLLFGAWYALPAVYLYLTYQKYLHSGGSTYQEGLLRKTFSPTAILSDWAFNVRYSLSFWSWQPSESHLEQGQIFMLAAGAVIVFLAGGLLCARREDSDWIEISSFRNGDLWHLLGAGFIFLVLSFPAYILLATVREPRRTQLLSAIAAAIVLGTVINILAGLIPRERWRPLVAILLAIPVMWVGASRTIERGGARRWDWITHVEVMRQLLRAVPNVKNGTVVVMINVPKDVDPFFHFAFWYNNALRLAYPRTTVAGVYYYHDGTPEPSNNLRLSGTRWEFTGESAAPLIRAASVDQTLVIEYDRSGTVKILPKIPSFVCDGQCSGQPYHPYARILGGPPAPETLRRYGPL